jgi:hypothetical protein
MPRCAEATQRRSLAEAGIDAPIDITDADETVLLAPVRAGDVVAVHMLHVLADRKLIGTHPRSHLFYWLRHLAARRAVIVETATGRRVDLRQISDYPILIDMAAEAVETITRGTQGRKAAQIARENGYKSDGRPRFDPAKNRQAVEAVHYAKPDRRLTGEVYTTALRRLGWSRAMAYRHLGGRDGKVE